MSEGGPGTSVGGGGQSSMPAQSDPTKAFSDKVDLNDLEWEDRERVLRLLFSKMNAGVQNNTLQARQSMKQAQTREENVRALSEHHQANMPDEQQMRAFREQYGNQAFDQYMQEESRRDEQSEYDQEEEG